MTFYFVLIASLAVSLYVGWRVLWALSRYKYRAEEIKYDSELPTVSVCIAARNEMHALAQCLDYVLTNTYEKVEILVLDDSSADDTSRIIQSYAHAGVRFIPGRDLPAGWLGKNHAYQTLSQEASGDYVLYLGVDTLIAPNTISQLVSQLVANKKKMLSVLPRREDGMRMSALFGTVRYLWELVYATRNTPPCSGALWLIERDTLLQLDKGLEDYGLSVRPELHLARQLQRTKDYYYIIGTHDLGVRYEKRLLSQFASSERIYYPLSGHRVLSAAVAGIFLGLLAVPYVLFPLAFLWRDYTVGILSIVVSLVTYVWYLAFSIDTYSNHGLLLRSILWPYLVIQEFLLLLHSYLRYTTRTVRWKGRSVHARPANRSHMVIDE